MALIAHQTQRSCSAFALRPKSWSKGVKLKSSVAFQVIDRTDKLLSFKHHLHISRKPIVSPRRRNFKVSSFKGNTQNGESEGRDNGSTFSKASLQLSSTQQDETISEPPGVPKHQLSCRSEDGDDTGTGSLAIQSLFRKWLFMLRTQTSSPTIDEKMKGVAHVATSESAKRNKVGEILKGVMVYFLGLDAAISLPLLIFIPWYLTVRVAHGAEVAKELTPLWVLGPLIIAFYIKIIKGLCFLYVFCFTQTIRLVMNLPTYFLSVYSYIAEIKLRAFLWDLFCKPIVDLVNLDYKDLLRKKWKHLKEWAVDKYQDYTESIWPYYCRTIRFLKKANLI